MEADEPITIFNVYVLVARPSSIFVLTISQQSFNMDLEAEI